MTQHQGLGWVVDDLTERVPEIAHVVSISTDGMLLAASGALPEPRAEQLAAIAAGLVSLTDAVARHCEADRVNHTIVEMDAGFLILMAISDGSSLAALAGHDCDIGQITYEMRSLVDRLGDALTPAPRTDPGPGDPDRSTVGATDQPAGRP